MGTRADGRQVLIGVDGRTTDPPYAGNPGDVSQLAPMEDQTPSRYFIQCQAGQIAEVALRSSTTIRNTRVPITCDDEVQVVDGTPGTLVFAARNPTTTVVRVFDGNGSLLSTFPWGSPGDRLVVPRASSSVYPGAIAATAESTHDPRLTRTNLSAAPLVSRSWR